MTTTCSGSDVGDGARHAQGDTTHSDGNDQGADGQVSQLSAIHGSAVFTSNAGSVAGADAWLLEEIPVRVTPPTEAMFGCASRRNVGLVDAEYEATATR